MSQKLTATVKIERVKMQAARALRESKYNQNKMEVLGYALGTLARIFATLDADKDDGQSIDFVASEILAEVTGRAKQEHFPADATQLQLGETMGVLSEQKSIINPKKSR
jgi:hypothetical protein